MDDASLSQDPNMGMDPNMGADPMMGGDPNMGMGPNMGSDPNMGMDPNMGGDQMMGGEDPNAMDTNTEGGDDTMSIINKLTDTDKEAVRKYAQSMIARDETQQDGDMGMDGEQQQMMEQVIFTKKQLNTIKENFGPSQDELMKKDDRKELPKKQSSGIKNSPFSPPKFQ